MSSTPSSPRRIRVERNIYRRSSGVYEVGFKDEAGKQHWRTVRGGITAARAVRNELLAKRHRGESIQPNVRLRFAEAATSWLEGPVSDLRARTGECYRNALQRHLVPRFGMHRLDAITPDDLAQLVRDMRVEGLSESTIAIAVGVTNRLYRFAARRLGWTGTNPVSLMLSSERPKPAQAKRRRIFEGAELEQTITAAPQPYRTLFTLAAITGARVSELLAVTWADVGLDDLDDAEIRFAWQLDRKGQRQPTKTDGSTRTVPMPRGFALILARHKLALRFVGSDHYVFCTRTGGPLRQRNVRRALRNAQRDAVDAECGRHSRCSTRWTRLDSRSRSLKVSCPRCTASAIRLPAGHCSRARALTRLRSFSVIATPTSHVLSTCTSWLTSGAGRCAAPGCSTSSAICSGAKDGVYRPNGGPAYPRGRGRS